jgi:hypothetical protein
MTAVFGVVASIRDRNNNMRAYGCEERIARIVARHPAAARGLVPSGYMWLRRAQSLVAVALRLPGPKVVL